MQKRAGRQRGVRQVQVSSVQRVCAEVQRRQCGFLESVCPADAKDLFPRYAMSDKSASPPPEKKR